MLSPVRRSFNTSGPCHPARDYMLPAMARLPEVRGLVERGKYFVIHAPRQTGKTTAVASLAQELTQTGDYVAALVSMEVGSAMRDDIGAAELAILGAWRSSAERRLPAELVPPVWREAPPGQRLNAALQAWAKAMPRPLVLFLDEIDSLEGMVLVSVLRQIRDGFQDRPASFPWSLALVGMRDVRDYKIALDGRDGAVGGSPFNIKDRSLLLRDFTRDEVAALYAQHTDDTGQAFLPETVDRAFALTHGQPWLTNALAAVAVDEIVVDRGRPIVPEHVDQARALIIERQDTHLDSLAERLRDPRIRAIVEPMLAGSSPGALQPDDIRLATDLGLLRQSTMGGLEVANPIYREIIVRELAASTRAALPAIAPTWLTPEGRLDPTRLLDAFVAFWRQHGEPLLGTSPYHEVAPHLVLMAFLHRVVNGGGSIEREYAIGRGRMDLCVRYGPDALAIELKVWRDRRPDPVAEGLAQLDSYLSGLGLSSGWLVVFDQRSGQAPIAERTQVEDRTTPTGRAVAVIRA
jgi:AAA domain